jgi:PKD repeat protein
MKTKPILLFCMVVLIMLSETYGQQFTITVKADCNPVAGNITRGTDDLQANFIGQNLFGEAPLQVKFIDQSTGEPKGWFWEFGDGATDTTQLPIHTYADPGIYTVRLTVSNNSDTSEFKRKDYVKVMVHGGCDSLNFPLPGEKTLYTILGNGGYISGNNSYGTLALASYFDDFEEGGELVAGIFDFAVAVKAFSNNIPVWFKAWDAT